ncbi:unnamed protein product [Amaranthus hypochondriacus]
MSSRSKQGQPMKVVHIKTQYVETDACSFKSVVQNLTGKDSTIADLPSSQKVMKVKNEYVHPRSRQQLLPRSRLAAMTGPERPDGEFLLDSSEENNYFQDYMGKSSGGSYSFLNRNLSYKEMDRLLKELPPLEELHKVLSFD